jgi:hypothetical protein
VVPSLEVNVIALPVSVPASVTGLPPCSGAATPLTAPDGEITMFHTPASPPLYVPQKTFDVFPLLGGYATNVPLPPVFDMVPLSFPAESVPVSENPLVPLRDSAPVDVVNVPLNDAELPSVKTSMPVAAELPPLVMTASVPLRVTLANAPVYVVVEKPGVVVVRPLSPPLLQAASIGNRAQSEIVRYACGTGLSGVGSG